MFGVLGEVWKLLEALVFVGRLLPVVGIALEFCPADFVDFVIARILHLRDPLKPC